MRLWGLLVKDARIVWRNWIVAIELLIVVIVTLLYHFALPDAFDMESTLYVTGDAALAARLQASAGDQVVVVDSREELTAAMKSDGSSYGAVLGMDGSTPTVELVFHGYESERVIHTAVLETEALDPSWRVATGVRITYVYGEARSGKLPFRTQVLILILLMEPALLGLFFAVTLILSEKEEGTARAYSVTPGGAARYLASKTAVIMALSLLSAGLLTGLTAPGAARWGWLLAVIAAGSFMGCALALLLSGFFDRLSAAMMVLSVVMVLLTLPMIALLAPSFSPGWMRLLPTWHLQFAIRECFYATGRAGILGWGVLYPLGVGAAAAGLAGLRFRRRLKA